VVTDPPEHNSQLTPIALGDYPCSFARWYWDVVNPESILVPAAFSDTYPAFLAQIILDELFAYCSRHLKTPRADRFRQDKLRLRC
jgi:hypothetical protein